MDFFPLYAALYGLFVVIAHLAVSAVLITLIYPRVKSPSLKYFSGRALAAAGFLTIPLPLYAFLNERPGLQDFFEFGGWAAYGVGLAAAWLMIIFGGVVQHLRNTRESGKLFWEADVHRMLQGKRFPKRPRPVSAFLSGAFYSNMYRPVVREVVVPVKGLPVSLSGLRILHVTDTHMGLKCGPDFYEAILDELGTWKCDMVFHTGDIISMDDRAEFAARWLGELGKRTEFGSYCVMGNHDLFLDTPRLSTALRKRGVKRLSHSWADVSWKNNRILITGSESPWERGDERDTMASGLHGSRADLVLGIAHEPVSGLKLLEAGAQTVFCGHTHGGQIRLGSLGPPVVTARCGWLYAHGLYDAAGGTLIVSAGLGSYFPPGRLGCPPEVLIATLCGK